MLDSQRIATKALKNADIYENLLKIEQKLASLFRMTDEVWARHANPWRVWTRFSVWETIFGMVIVILGKSWFLDRMVWLYDEMKDANPDYRSWLY